VQRPRDTTEGQRSVMLRRSASCKAASAASSCWVGAPRWRLLEVEVGDVTRSEFLLSLEVLARGLRRHSTRTSVPPPPPRSSGVPARGHTERSQRASGVAAAPRPRAAGAPAARACAPAARPRAARGGACTHSNGHVQVRVVVVVVVVGDNSAKFSRQSSQNLGKYNLVIYF
jgi:hypothetical protein